MARDSREELLKRARYGYRVAFAGLALQLAGFAWDAHLHHLDPTLAARESVFSLANPGHLLVVLGLGLAAAGVAWGMFLVSSDGSGSRILRGPTLAFGILGVFSLLTGGMAIATGGLSGGHEQNPEHAGITVDDPVLAELKGVLATEGTGEAMDRLEELAAEDEDLERASHHYVHELGKYSYSHYGGDAARAFGLCDRSFAGGCYHGVVQAYFEAKPDLETEELAGLCEGVIVGADATEILTYQCVHGLGHGLSIASDHDLHETLRRCDALKTERNRRSCYGGAFMENTMFAQGQDEASAGAPLIREDDLHYPCNSVESRYKQECYFLQPAAILLQNGRDVEGAFEECDKAPRPYVAACYRGMGRDVSSLARGNADESRDMCLAGTDSYEAWCFEGVVTLLISNNWRTDEAVGFCAGVPTWARSRCFEVIGEMVPGLHADAASRIEECEKAEEEEWVAACRRSAGLVSHEQRSEDSDYPAMGAMGTGGHRIPADDPMLIEVKEVLISDGTRAALDRVGELAAKDEGFSASHQYAHELGRFSYAHLGGDVAEAFGRCDGRFQGGCYHGTLEAYFEDEPDLAPNDLPDFCDGGMVDARATGMIEYNCLHGLGHGLSIFFDHDLREPLRYCDFLRTGQDRAYCYNGVFMENMVFSLDRHDRAGQAGSPEDPHYPCNSVADRYKRECYAYQPLAILLQNGRDFDAMFDACDDAAKPYIAACYGGMGKAISALTRWDPDESRDLCMLGTAAYRNWCLEGVVRVLISEPQKTAGAFDFCASVPAWFENRCFETIGESVPDLYADTASRNAECEKAQEERWIAVCRRSAGLGGWSEDETL